MSTTETSRWTITVTTETDRSLRALLGVRGMRKGDLSRFVEDAVRWRIFDQSVQDLKSRHADMDGDALQAAIDEACLFERAHSSGRTGKSL
jgi:hypothetical protein